MSVVCWCVALDYGDFLGWGEKSCSGWFFFQMAPDYDHLTLMEKVEVFEHAVNNTAGDDLAKLLWLKSPSSEVRCSASFFFFLVGSIGKDK